MPFKVCETGLFVAMAGVALLSFLTLGISTVKLEFLI